jgi:hypothetical protein
MKTVKHQLANKDFYIPQWPVKHLFLGTFNPEGGDPVHYYYGRSKNQLWPLLRELTGSDFQLDDSTTFFSDLKNHGIACMDMIHAVSVPDEDLDYVFGKGYSDTKIINGYTEREYNTSKINQVIEQNPGVKVYSTWGKGQPLMEWTNEVAKIEGIVPLASPSMAARIPKGEKKFGYMLNDWSSKIEIH